MKYLTFMRSSEKLNETPPPPALMAAMGPFIEKSLKEGVLVDTGGLLPSKEGSIVHLRKGELIVTDGPFTETKEVIGGYAILKADTKAGVMRAVREYLELYRKHWPEFEGECEVRALYEENAAPAHR